MVGKTNVGGGAKAFAVISVTYPAGSVCTCTDGSKTLKLKDTSGQGIFLIPYAATWTVTCTDGTKTKSEVVKITSDGQSVSVNISYMLYLYKLGNVFDAITGGYIYKYYEVSGTTASGVGTLESTRAYLRTTGANGIRKDFLFTNNKLDLSAYNTLVIKGKLTQNYSFSEYSAGLQFGISESNDPADLGIIRKQLYTPLGDFEERIDISDVSEGYFEFNSYFYDYSDSQRTGEGYFYEVWLE